MLRIVIRLTFYLILGTLFLLVATRYGWLEGWKLWGKALVAVAFAFGMFHGWLQRRRHSARISRRDAD
jgi:hypothetical protein